MTAIIDPNSDLNNAINQWTEENNQYQADCTLLAALIAQMIQLCAKGGQGTQEAFQIAELGVMPTVMSVQGDSVGQVGASMNIASACQEFVTQMQNDINNGANITPDQAADFLKQLKGLYDAIKAELNLPKDQQWIDPSTAQNLLNGLTSLSGEFSVGMNPDDLANIDPALIAQDINIWVTQPTADNTGQTGAPNESGLQHMQGIGGDFQTNNNVVGAQNQTLNAEMQFQSGNYNQYMGIVKSMLQATQQSLQVMVQNLKSQ